MNKEDQESWKTLAKNWMFVLLIAVMSFISGTGLGISLLQSSAIKQGFAEYNTQTGAWQWRTNYVVITNITVTSDAKFLHLPR